MSQSQQAAQAIFEFVHIGLFIICIVAFIAITSSMWHGHKEDKRRKAIIAKYSKSSKEGYP